MLQMKKTMALVLTLAVVAGCATTAPQVNSVSTTAAKVEAVKVTPVIDLGNKDGASLNMKLQLQGKKTPFGIKTIIDGFGGQAAAAVIPGSNIVIKIHRYKIATAIPGTPASRFDDESVTLGEGFLTKIDGFTNASTAPLKDFNQASVLPITLKGLNLGWKYTVSARAYVNGTIINDGFNTLTPVDGADLKVDVSKTTPGDLTKATTGGGNFLDFSNFNINPTDVINIAGSNYRVNTVAAGTINIVPLLSSGGPAVPTVPGPTSQAFSLVRNVVGTTGTGGPGGGTAAPMNGATEVTVNVANNGVVSLAGALTTATNLDFKIQLMDDIKAAVSGKVSLLSGVAITPGGETITSP